MVYVYCVHGLCVLCPWFMCIVSMVYVYCVHGLCVLCPWFMCIVSMVYVYCAHGLCVLCPWFMCIVSMVYAALLVCILKFYLACISSVFKMTLLFKTSLLLTLNKQMLAGHDSKEMWNLSTKVKRPVKW